MNGMCCGLLMLIVGATIPMTANASETELRAAGVAFPFGVYEKSDGDPSTQAWRDEVTAIVAKVASQGFNTLVTQAYRDPAQTLFLLDRAREAGLGVVQTIGNPHNRNWDRAGRGERFDAVYRHPAILAYKFGDEPGSLDEVTRLEEGYRAIGSHYEPPVVTVMVGESVDSTTDSITVAAWQRLQPRILAARYYPYRRTFGLRDDGGGKAKLPFVAWCARMEALAGDRPWWYVAQGLGNDTLLSAGAYWRLPTAAEISAMVHVALAHGARGVLVFALQPAAGEGRQLRLLDERLEPVASRDGSLPFEAYGALARLVARHADWFSRHRAADEAWTSSVPSVIAVGRRDPQGPGTYVYAINLDGETPQRARLRSGGAAPAIFARDVFRGHCVRLLPGPGPRVLDIELAPGEGRLFHLLPEEGAGGVAPQCNGHTVVTGP